MSNKNYPFFTSLLEVLSQYFEQEDAYRINFFWMAIPSSNNSDFQVRVLCNWKINDNDVKVSGGSYDEVWPAKKFSKSFWGCEDSHQLTRKIQEMLDLHPITSSSVEDFKNLLGKVFVKENWQATARECISDKNWLAWLAAKEQDMLFKIIQKTSLSSEEDEDFESDCVDKL